MNQEQQEFQYKLDAFEELNKTVRSDAIVFAGDSITEGFAIHELFPSHYPLYNRGISGFTSAQILEGIQKHIIGLEPKKVFLLIGTNDLGRGGTVEETGERIEQICKIVIQQVPRCKIYLFFVYPINQKLRPLAVGNRNNHSIVELNQKIAGIAGKYEAIELVDLSTLLKDEEGNLKEEYTYDGLHLRVEGYREIAKQLLPLLE